MAPAGLTSRLMKTRIVTLLMLSMPFMALAQTPSAGGEDSKPEVPRESSRPAGPPDDASPAPAIHGDALNAREVVRQFVRRQDIVIPPRESPPARDLQFVSAPAPATTIQLSSFGDLPSVAVGRNRRMDCDSFQCRAYDDNGRWVETRGLITGWSPYHRIGYEQVLGCMGRGSAGLSTMDRVAACQGFAVRDPFRPVDLPDRPRSAPPGSPDFQ
jgi:hypothetical protein